MKSFLYLAPLLLVFAVVGVSAYVRLAPTDPARWHVDPADPALSSGRGGVLVRPGGDLESPVFAEAPSALLARFAEIADATPRTRVLAGSVAEGRITFVTRSLLWGFPDYTTVEAVPEGDGARLVIYARLRFGDSDLGVNRARVEGWLAALSG